MWYAAAAGVWVTSERVDRTLFSDCPGGLSPLLIAAACRVGARIVDDIQMGATKRYLAH